MRINVFKIWQRYSVVIIFYDGYCPLCIAEMRHLRKRDKHNKLTLVDIQAPDFSNRYPTMDWHALNARIHGLREDGTLITGLDVTHEAGKPWAWVGYMHRFAGLYSSCSRCFLQCIRKA